MKSRTLLDVRSVMREGVEVWQKYFFWPISIHDGPRLYADLNDVLKRMIKECADEEMKRVLVVGYLVAWECCQPLMALKQLQSLEGLGYDPVPGSQSDLYRALLEGEPIPGPLSTKMWDISRLRLKTALRTPINFYFSWKYNLAAGKLPRLGGSKEGRRWVALYQPGPVCENFMATLPHWVHVRLIVTWFNHGGLPRLSDDLDRRIDRQVEKWVSGVEEVAERHDVRVKDEILEHTGAVAATIFRRVAKDLIRVRDALRREGPIHYLGVSGTNYYSRILSLIVSELGGTVTAFSHGGDTCRYLRDYSILEFSTCDNFGVQNANCAGLFQHVFEVFPPPSNRRVQFLAAGDPQYLSAWRQNRSRGAPTRIKRVMLIGEAYHGDRFLPFQYPDLVRLDFKWRIVQTLRTAGYQVLYKQHPGGIFRGEQIDCFPPDVEVVRAPFETVLDQADAFVFPNSYSTTMPYSLCTQKPVIYLRTGFEPWLEQPYELFSKRAQVVPCGVDERNRIEFDEQALLRALRERPEKPDEGFLRTYLIPEGLS